jgi:hypothetical protein
MLQHSESVDFTRAHTNADLAKLEERGHWLSRRNIVNEAPIFKMDFGDEEHCNNFSFFQRSISHLSIRGTDASEQSSSLLASTVLVLDLLVVVAMI